jgi:hypothetical protein
MMDFTPHLPGKHEKHEAASSRKRRVSGVMIAIAVLSVATIASTASATVFYVKLQDARQKQSAPSESEKDRIAAKVGKLYDIPNEEPTLARVSDPEKLRKEQDFFKNAKDGDYILVFPEAKIGILYRESTDKIINIGPVSVQPTTNETGVTPSQQSGRQ